MLKNVEPQEVILGPNNRVHVVVATRQEWKDPGQWKPFPNEADVSIRELLDKLPENDVFLKELVEKWRRPKPTFLIVDVRLEDLKPATVHRIADQEEDMKIVRDVVCEAVVVTTREYQTIQDYVDVWYHRPRHYIVIADGLSKDQIAIITALMSHGHRCRECCRKRDLEVWFREVWLAACTQMMHLDVARQIVGS